MASTNDDGDGTTPPMNKDLQDGGDGDDGQTWVLDSLVGFLKSPLWSSSLNDFIDRNSIVFESDGIENEQGQVVHCIEYEKIFRQYRSLVDRLIGTHMTELGIDEHQFADACRMAEGVLAAKFKRILFEELWAAENYDVFVRLMAKRNVELQLEALEMLVHKYGLVYDVFVPIGTSPKNFLSEEHAMREAILRSLNDMQLEEEEEEEAEAEHRDSKMVPKKREDSNEEEQEEKSDQADKETARLAEVKQLADRKMMEALQSAMTVNDGDNPGEETAIQNEEDIGISNDDDAITAKMIDDDDDDRPPAERRLSAIDIAKRADYLREQRDKILRQRQKERTERISKYLIKEKQTTKNMRTSKTEAETAGTSNPDEEAATAAATDETQQSAAADPVALMAFRKSLAARLKAEVVLGGIGDTKQPS